MSDIISVVPWGLHPLPTWVYEEMQRRGQEYDINILADKGPYSGPRTAWVRFFSNGKSKLEGASELDGFVLGGVYDFEESFGFTPDKKNTIGVDARGLPHKIKTDTSVSEGRDKKFINRSDFSHRPPPSVDSVTCEMAGSNAGFPNACRKVTINWKCHSLAQLNYLTPYFLTPRITCLVEWGWSNYDTNSLVDLTDLDWINKMFTDPSYTLEYLKSSNGNYDAGIGFVVDYTIKMNEAGGYDCSTTIINASRLVEGEQLNNKTVTIKDGNNQLPIKNFKEFVSRDLKNIDSDKPKMVKMRSDLNIGEKAYDDEGYQTDYRDNIKETIFRIKNDDSSSNKPGMWLRMDLVANIINSFFEVTMSDPCNGKIRNFDISETKIAASPFIKSVGKNILVPNQYAPRFIFKDTAATTVTVEDATYTNLFKQRSERITEEYKLESVKFDNLKSVINPYGKSFPVYEDVDVYTDIYEEGEPEFSQALKSGYWGYLKDIFIKSDHFVSLVEKNDSLLKLIEQLLQDINEALCQICQLKLIPAEYGNEKYSVYDENLPAISTVSDAARLPRISLGSVNNNSIKSISFDVKVSSEMMSQLVMQSANPGNDKDGSTQTKNVKADPIESRYSDGDRLYEKGNLSSAVASDITPGKQQQPNAQQLQELAQQQKEEAAALKKKQLERSEEKFKDCIYYKKDTTGKLQKYYICEPEKQFMNYVLSIPDTKAVYQNNAIMPNTTLTLELLGISGMNFLSQFTIDHAPETYNYSNAVWQVSDTKQSIEDKNWTTTIVAQVRPLTVL
jgi:hypothetical protein